ncbi:transporter substrate-binding domain-containing protein [Rhodoplanes azumiensis]|uniref:Transporter substrate-binding domain-containing protein n=1 Tax=Rhodoplanes azumiensis TaxID=1897628 RepID=A0ABW5AKC2_9BRAD
MRRQTSPGTRKLRQVARASVQKRVKIALLAGLVAGLAGLTGIVGGPGPLGPSTAHAQTASPGLPIPGFWDPKRRPERPDLRLTLIRFMSEVDYPPFNYAGPDGNPAGFNIDLARAICDELKIACTIQMRRFDTLIESLAENRGDAAIASIAVTPETRKKIDFSDPYYRPVARFAARRGSGLDTVLPERVEGKTIAVVAGTAHEAYLKALFTEAELKPYPSAEDARAALQKGEVDLLFGDGYGLAFWLNGADAAGCCTFVGGPFVESRYFGEGVGIAVKKGNDQLRLAMNWALFRLWEKGRFADLWLKYFPINPF